MAAIICFSKTKCNGCEHFTYDNERGSKVCYQGKNFASKVIERAKELENMLPTEEYIEVGLNEIKGEPMISLWKYNEKRGSAIFLEDVCEYAGTDINELRKKCNENSYFTCGF